MDSYSLSLRERLSWGHETKRKHLPGGLAAAILSDLSKKGALADPADIIPQTR
jgi:hypothetical protein